MKVLEALLSNPDWLVQGGFTTKKGGLNSHYTQKKDGDLTDLSSTDCDVTIHYES